jgi:hypothetical protein
VKKLALIGLVFFAILSGAAIAQQSGGQEKGPSMKDMMQHMTGGETPGNMMGMMRMMEQMSKMMDQCSAMMGSMHGKAEKTEQGKQQ